jgi:F-type H+-transporting ATPase subunit a
VNGSPLASAPLFHIGPVPIALAVVTTWGIMLALVVVSLLATRRLEIHPGRIQAAVELLVTTLERQISETTSADPAPFVPLLGTLFIYLAFANASAVVPGMHPPTAQIETAGALALVVFCAVHYYGIRRRGLVGYLRSFARPTILMVPFNILSNITRTFSLMIRLFGNVMSGEFMIGIVLALAGLLVPIPLMALEVLVGLVQAYIFSVLAAVFVGAAVGSIEGG